MLCGFLISSAKTSSIPSLLCTLGEQREPLLCSAEEAQEIIGQNWLLGDDSLPALHWGVAAP